MTTVASIKSVLNNFLEELDDEFDDPHDIERILNGDRAITQRDIGAEPETWTEDILINPIINAGGLHKAPGRPTSQRKTPDFKLEEEEGGQSFDADTGSFQDERTKGGSQSDRIKCIGDIIDDINRGGDPADIDDVLTRAQEEMGLSPTKTEEYLKKLKNQVKIYESGPDAYLTT